MVTTPPYEFRDPIHGFIQVYPHERKITDTPEFQRLRRIHQLGLTYYVYHGAEHSRFGHSLGVMHLAGKATENLIDNNLDLVREKLEWSEPGRERRMLFFLARLAGLLHDIGHAPFSHTGESELFPIGHDGKRLKHEDYSEAVILQTSIGQIIGEDQQCVELGITKELVAQLINGKAALAAGFVQELVSSPWDVDKMDYLLRDSHYCGVQYGTFDLERLLNTLTLDPEDPGGGLKLGIDEGGIYALEGFVLARYFMFTQVYLHKVRRAFDLVLTDFIKELLTEEYGVGQYPPLARLEDYLSWNDGRVLGKAQDKRNPDVKNPAWRIVDRVHPKLVYATPLPFDAAVIRKAHNQLPGEAQSRFPNVRFWVDYPIYHPQKFSPEDIEGLMVRYETPPRWGSFSTASRALSGLEASGQVRLYADVRGNDTLEERAKTFCRQFMG